MLTKRLFLILALFLLLSGCAPLTQIARSSGTAPTPVVSYEQGGVDHPDVFVDAAAFRGALIKALAGRDTQKLKLWMTDPFFAGVWRGKQSDVAQAEALKALSNEQLAAQIQLAEVKDVDLKALMGGKDPLSLPGDPDVTEAFLVSGWGQSGMDEAILFISRQADNSLKWRGWVQVKGGFSGARLGGIQAYQNEGQGFRVYVPKDFEISVVPNVNQVSIIAPRPQGGGDPAMAFITTETAGERTAEQAAQQMYQENRAIVGAAVFISPVMDIGGEKAYVVNGVSGQDFNRRLFMVHGGVLYQIIFMPDNPNEPAAYRQMLDVYAMVVNTFQFTR